ncbi:MAG: phosphatase PAP2 family protein [Desulfovibrionaceae bacterium]|nr:phosphatase PAP2 family protein [Desulfovibrionaceae bacterium]
MLEKQALLPASLLLTLALLAPAPAGARDAGANAADLAAPGSIRGEVFIAPPPAFDSVAFLLDRARYQEGFALRQTERGRQAAVDAEDRDMAPLFSEAFGMPVTSEGMPETYRLIAMARKEITRAPRTAKKHYARVRPYTLYNDATCTPRFEDELRHTGSYPSGHSTRAWGVALVLSEVNPARCEEIMKRAWEMGQSRVICGYHWQSDVEAGRLVGAAAAAALHADPAFQAQLAKAKAEFAALAKEAAPAR